MAWVHFQQRGARPNMHRAEDHGRLGRTAVDQPSRDSGDEQDVLEGSTPSFSTSLLFISPLPRGASRACWGACVRSAKHQSQLPVICCVRVIPAYYGIHMVHRRVFTDLFLCRRWCPTRVSQLASMVFGCICVCGFSLVFFPPALL